MYCAGLCCPSALRMALHCFPSTTNQAPSSSSGSTSSDESRQEDSDVDPMSSSSEEEEEEEEEEEIPLQSPPPPPGRPSLGDRLPPPSGRPSRATPGLCKGGGGYVVSPPRGVHICSNGAAAMAQLQRWPLAIVCWNSTFFKKCAHVRTINSGPPWEAPKTGYRRGTYGNQP